MDELLSYRKEFPILDRTTYMISHSLGAMPRGVYDRLRAYADIWATRGIRAWAEGWWEMPVTTGDKLARIIGADPGSVAMHQNVSVCQSIILSAPELRRSRPTAMSSSHTSSRRKQPSSTRRKLPWTTSMRPRLFTDLP